MKRIFPLLAAPTACQNGQGPNLFTIEDDKELGLQVRDEILADPETYPVMSEAEYPEAYGHLLRIRDDVLSERVPYADTFDWEVYLIHDDETLNAFATPGGYLFFYTGLIKYLDEEDHFAGVMGHEIGHAARRHSTQQLTTQYGIVTLLEVVFGDDQGGTAGEIAAGLASLQFSREDESDADTQSVAYLCPGPKAADGAAGFFAKLLEEGGDAGVPEFLSTHPSPANRVEAIEAQAVEWDCNLEPDPTSMWAEFQASLP